MENENEEKKTQKTKFAPLPAAMHLDRINICMIRIYSDARCTNNT